MHSCYIQPHEYALYNLEEGISTSVVIETSLLIDSYCNRPEGFVHNGVVMESTGAPLTELTVVPYRRRVTLSRRPAATILSAYMALGTTAPFDWQPIPPNWELDSSTAQLWLTPATPFPARLKINYLAGYLRDDLPEDLKVATSILASSRAAHTEEDLPSNVKKASAGDSTLEFFPASAKSNLSIDPEVRQLLAPYVRVI